MSGVACARRSPSCGGPPSCAPGRPTPLDEVRSAMVFFDATLFTTTPRLYRALDAALDRLATGRSARASRPLPTPADEGRTGPVAGPRRSCAGARWIGGDRDGHPSCTAETTARGPPDPGRPRAPRATTRPPAADETSPRGPGGALDAAALPPPPRRCRRAPGDHAELRRRFPREPYRRRLGAIAERLRADPGRPGRRCRARDGGRYDQPETLLAELGRAGASALVADGLGRVAHGARSRTSAGRWRPSGSTSPRSRCASTAASTAPAARRLWPAPRRRCDREVEPGVDGGRGPGHLSGDARPSSVVSARRRGRRYVISFTEGPADVRDVLELARLAADASIPAARTSGIAPGAPVLDVVPLFESADALAGAPDDPGRAPRRPRLPSATCAGAAIARR